MPDQPPTHGKTALKRVAVIGCGALGQAFALNLNKVLSDRYVISGFLVRRPPGDFLEKIGCAQYQDLDQLLADAPDYVVEFAGVAAVAEYGESVLRRGIDLIIVSAGALADHGLYDALRRAAGSSGCRIHIASGAIGGFDLMRTFALMGPMEASIENFKPPENLEGAPHLAGHRLSRTETETIFRGSVAEAIRGFPKNVNVAVAADLATAGDMAVVIQSVPGLTENRHVIQLKTDGARAELTIASTADPQNPRSSTLAAWSVIALLDQLDSVVRFF